MVHAAIPTNQLSSTTDETTIQTQVTSIYCVGTYNSVENAEGKNTVCTQKTNEKVSFSLKKKLLTAITTIMFVSPADE